MLEMIILTWTIVGAIAAIILYTKNILPIIGHPYRRALVTFACGLLLWISLLGTEAVYQIEKRRK